MNEQKKREAMARLEGWTHELCSRKWARDKGLRVWRKPDGELPDFKLKHPDFFPAYESLDDVQRVVDGLDDGELQRYHDTIAEMMELPLEYDYLVHRATPAQKVEAILKAKGVWDE